MSQVKNAYTFEAWAAIRKELIRENAELKETNKQLNNLNKFLANSNIEWAEKHGELEEKYRESCVKRSENIDGIFSIRKEFKSIQIDLEELADYLIENASEAFEHQDRELLIKALKQWDKRCKN